ncbi:MAG: site-specific integrase [Akkermansia sp.]|nr:site-specific integrase [Akkermansia sp.]
MKSNHIAKQLLKGVSLSQSDLARLALEAIESLGDLAEGLDRIELITLLRNTLREGVSAMKAAAHTVSLEEAAWASVEARRDLRPTSRRDLRHFVRRLLKVPGAAVLPLRAITPTQCKKILTEAFGASPSSFVKGRAILHSIFTYGMKQEWCDSNPVSRIDVPKVKEKAIVPLAPAEVEKLKETAQRPEFRDMQLSLSLMLYGGIRPTEVSRLQESDFDWENKQVIIRPSTSKTGGGRTVPLRGIKGIRKKDLIIPQGWNRKWHDLRRAAGYRGKSWVPDVCRHTFASYHAAYFRNLAALQLEMGHRDASLLMTRYMAPALKKDAEAFWQGAK